MSLGGNDFPSIFFGVAVFSCRTRMGNTATGSKPGTRLPELSFPLDKGNGMKATTEGLAAQVSPHALTVGEFCESHRISRALFYLLQKTRRGPRVMKCGRRTLISAEAASDWRKQMERAEA
jgi:hypothetical protein